MKAKIILPGIVLVFTLSPIVVYAVSQYDSDGFTIFHFIPYYSTVIEYHQQYDMWFKDIGTIKIYY
jgi:hypothetical protein